MRRVLICDDDRDFQLTLKLALKRGFQCFSAYDGDEAAAILRKQRFDLLLLDVRMRSSREGLECIQRFKAIDPDLPVIMISGSSEFETVRAAMQNGADDYVRKDFDVNELLLTLERSLKRRADSAAEQLKSAEIARNEARHVLIGESGSLVRLRRVIEKCRASQGNVLIHGETGVGKEAVARQMRTRLADGSLAPFVSIDSATIQQSMAESLLFGHEKGAFTGADQARKGLFEQADGGTIYFDEIANMPLEIQAKLLRVIQEQEVTRLGSERPIPLRFRVICATNRDLDEMVREGRFKDDLLQRISAIPVEVSPLRERREDVPPLARHFVQKQGRAGLTFASDAMSALIAYDWPGNVRELQNMVIYVSTMVDGNQIELQDLPPKIQRTVGAAKAVADASFYEKVARFERSLLREAYVKAAGNVSQLARQLGMDRSHLHGKLAELGIHKKKPAPSMKERALSDS